ncbi:hypothetical protein [Gemmiger formicilis]|uniref:hypothetical protein n=1 Tax=Gemmiger formicilis TaxID=745368 RepID=UPI003CCACD0D
MNLIALARTPDSGITKAEIEGSLARIDYGANLHVPIKSTDGKSCVLPYCPEAAVGQTVTASGAKIASVNHTNDEKGEPDETIVELSKTPGDVVELLIPAPVTAAARMGLSVADLEAIKGVVNAL